MLKSRYSQLVLIFALAGCKSSSSGSTVKIIQGTKPPPGSISLTSTVNLHLQFKRLPPTQKCTGTLITQDIVVTAAHCFENMSRRKMLATFTDNADFADQTRWIEVKEWKVFPRWSLETSAPNYDIAWARLSRPAPADKKPAEVLRSNAIVRTTPKAAKIAGFGKTATGCKDCSGVLFEAETQVTEFIENDTIASLMVVNDSDGNQSACHGDSGGPLFVEKAGKWFLAGATHGYNAKASFVARTEDNACEAGHILYTFVGAYLDWIQSTEGIKLGFNETENPAASGERRYTASPCARLWATHSFIPLLKSA
jgi:secreted trypsin-like serine protease